MSVFPIDFQDGVNAGALNGSVPRYICSSGNFLLARRFGRNNMSPEGKSCSEKGNLGCLRGFHV